MATMRRSDTGMVWHVHHGYARSSCRHRTEHAMRKCAERVERKRQRDRAAERG